jgi:hypothetical protein
VCRGNIWFYRDRTGLPRGPMTITTVRKAYINGVVDQHTLFWGNGLGDWVPLRNIRGMASCLSDPKTRFVQFLINRFAFPKKQRRENRDALYDEGLAKSPSFSRDEAAAWRKRREEALVSGEESTMLSLSLGVPRHAKAVTKVKGFFAARFGKEKEEEGGLRLA